MTSFSNFEKSKKNKYSSSKKPTSSPKKKWDRKSSYDNSSSNFENRSKKYSDRRSFDKPKYERETKNYPGVIIDSKKRKKIFSINLVPGKKVYGEALSKKRDMELREWEPKRSKLGAAIVKNIKEIGFMEADKILYLGAASGTTVSHCSDIVGKNGFVFALDFAPRVVRDLVYLCEDRKNIAPMMFDANKPDEYAHLVLPEVDFVFMDIAQKNQTEIFIKNVKRFLKKNGLAMLALKARSVDVTKKPHEIFKTVKKELEKEFQIVDEKVLDPFEKDHTMFLVRKLN